MTRIMEFKSTTDTFGKPLKVGDTVAYVGCSGYRGSRGNIGVGYVHSFTPKGIRLTESKVMVEPFVRFPWDVILMESCEVIE